MSVFKADCLAGKVALVTGGASGIGKQIAITLGQHGAKIFIASRKRENLQQACDELKTLGISCHFAVCDIRQIDQVETMLEQLQQDCGQLDIVINNAAGNFPAAIDNISAKGFKTIVDIDLLGTYNVTKSAYEKFLKSAGGHIVNISAPFQHGGASYQSHVAAAKAGVDSLTRSCAVEFGPRGIRVNAVAPGATADTEGMQRFEQATPEYDARCPLAYTGSKKNIADAVLFLVSEAASYITGQVICVDGGSSVDLLKMT